MANKYIIDLTAAEHEELCHLLKQGKPSARKVARAHMLLHAAEGATDEEIAAILRVGLSTVHRTRQRFVEGGAAECTHRAEATGRDPQVGWQTGSLFSGPRL
jgi:putative transposase